MADLRALNDASYPTLQHLGNATDIPRTKDAPPLLERIAVLEKQLAEMDVRNMDLFREVVNRINRLDSVLGI